jgi:hypothetical protein
MVCGPPKTLGTPGNSEPQYIHLPLLKLGFSSLNLGKVQKCVATPEFVAYVTWRSVQHAHCTRILLHNTHPLFHTNLLAVASLFDLLLFSLTVKIPLLAFHLKHLFWVSFLERPSLQGVKSTSTALVCCCQRQLFHQLLDLSHPAVCSCLLSISLPPV